MLALSFQVSTKDPRSYDERLPKKGGLSSKITGDCGLERLWIFVFTSLLRSVTTASFATNKRTNYSISLKATHRTQYRLTP